MVNVLKLRTITFVSNWMGHRVYIFMPLGAPFMPNSFEQLVDQVYLLSCTNIKACENVSEKRSNNVLFLMKSQWLNIMLFNMANGCALATRALLAMLCVSLCNLPSHNGFPDHYCHCAPPDRNIFSARVLFRNKWAKGIHELEKVQRRASRNALGQRKQEMAHEDRCKILKWNCLERRREFLSLAECYKIVFNLNGLNFSDYFELCKSTKTRSNRQYKIQTNLPKLNC